jgi:hypothetical protein
VPSPTPTTCARDLKYTVHAFTRMGRGVQQAARLRMRDDATGSSQWRRRCNECGDFGVRSYGPASCEVSPTNTRANVGWPQQQVAGSVSCLPCRANARKQMCNANKCKHYAASAPKRAWHAARAAAWHGLLVVRCGITRNARRGYGREPRVMMEASCTQAVHGIAQRGDSDSDSPEPCSQES